MATQTLDRYKLFEVLKNGGPIVAHHEPTGMIITINEVCFAAWTCIGNGYFVGGSSCLVSNIEKVGDCTDFRLVVEAGQEWLLELVEKGEDGEDEEPSNS